MPETYQYSSIVLLLLPYYVSIMLGFLLARIQKIHKETVAALLVNIIVPIVIFSSIANMKLTLGTLALPFIFFLIGAGISIAMYLLGKLLWRDSTKNIFAFTTGTANLGYFGLPVGIALFGADQAGIIMLASVGLMFYENTLGYFFLAKSHFSVRDSLLKVVKLPILHGFILGIAASFFSVQFDGPVYENTIMHFRGAFSILGMMMIGIGLADVKKVAIDSTFTLLCLLVKYLLWPIAILGVLYIDAQSAGLFDPMTRNIMIMLSVMPQTTSTVIFSIQLNVHPEKAAVAVSLSFIAALFIIPFVFLLL